MTRNLVHWGLDRAMHLTDAQKNELLRFPGALSMGKIFYRTAVACVELGDKETAKGLLTWAAIYLPNDENVKKEIERCTL